MPDNGFNSPEAAAMSGFPPQHCRVIASRTQGHEAYVLLDTGSAEQPYLYGVICRRENGHWFEQGSGNGSGWTRSDDSSNVGTLYFWDDAPRGADMVRIEFDGRLMEEPVVERAYLAVWWRLPEPAEWPVVRAFRIHGQWRDTGAFGVRG